MATARRYPTLVQFEAVVHRTKDRLVAIPAQVQRHLSLRKRRDNHIIAFSIRPAGQGRWNHHLAKLTYDNEFAIPADVTRLRGGARVEVKIHRVIPDVPTDVERAHETPGAVLLALAQSSGDDPRTDGSRRVDEYLLGLRSR
ncbi:MAG: hypothetical protein HY906_09015 [Deltaproteobacteria bacterium]|nr:hypothetical protein [Deltaproteobacteria bacterium]